MEHLHLFDTETEYNAAKSGFKYPSVSHVQNINDVRYMKLSDKYAKKYLTTEALEDGTISFNIWYSMGTDMITSISYSTDNGDTWTTTNNTNNKSENLQISVNVEQGDKVLWKGIATQTGCYDTDDWDDIVGSFFSSDCEYKAYGNVMSLLHGDDFYGVTSLGNTEYTFAFLFYNYYDDEAYPIVSAEHLVLPATILTEGCYSGIFRYCTSLTTAPELPATTLAQSVYWGMFEGCTALTTAPKLPATILTESCYSGMFNRCTSLTTAPELPATTLAQYCYSGMFYGCTKLNYIKAMFTTTPSTTYTNNWVGAVAASGTFVKNSAAQWNSTGINSVPSGWTVQTASA